MTPEEELKRMTCRARISFDAIEGDRPLQGRVASDALSELEKSVSEAVRSLAIPVIESQESERADRH